MRGWEGIRRVFRLGLAGGDADREVDRELSFHFEETVSALRTSGMSESEARSEAARRFGDERLYRRELRRLARGRDRRARTLDALRGAWDIALEIGRGASRSPGLSVAVVVVMGVGLGANAVVFGMLDRVFLSAPPHVDNPDAVRRVFVTRRINGDEVTGEHHPYPDYRDWRDLDVFGSTAAYSLQQLAVGRGTGVARRPVGLVTASFFPLLGVRPALGRFFDAADDRFGADRVAVLSHGYWQTAQGGDPAVLGRSVLVGDAEYTVVGVAPRGFTGVELEAVDVWLPFHPAGEVEEGGREWVESRGWYWFNAVTRVAEGVPVERAAAAATAAHRAARADQERYDPEARVTLEPLLKARTSLASREARLLPWLMGVAGMVLLLTVANVANLLLARSTRRRRETAVRVALGVSRGRLVGTAVAETLLLTLMGGGAALLLALWGGELVRSSLLPGLASYAGYTSGHLVIFIMAVSLLAGTAAAFPPAFRASRPDVTRALRASGRGVTGGRTRARTALLVVQAAISVVLLVGTGLFVESLRQARDVDLGFEPDGVLLVRLEPEGGYPGGEAMTRLYRDARARLEGFAGTGGRAISTTTPLRSGRGVGLRLPGRDSLPPAQGGRFVDAVTGDYFEVLGLEILRGRPLTDADDAPSAAPVAVVNRAMAESLWPDEDALGSCIIVEDGPCATVVGIVENSRVWELVEDPIEKYYVPLAQAPFPWPPSRMMIATADPLALARPVREALQTSVPGVRLVTTEPMVDVVSPKYRAWTLGASLFTVMGVLALIVAAVGLYGILAFDVAQRRPELGVRSALGAGRGRLTRLVVGDGLRLAAMGIAAGLLVTLVAAPRIEPLLFRTRPLEPGILAAVGLVILLVAVAASGLPAWRAARVDPNEALRAE